MHTTALLPATLTPHTTARPRRSGTTPANPATSRQRPLSHPRRQPRTGWQPPRDRRRIAGARCSPQTLEPLADELDASHRLAIAEPRVADTLAGLPSDRWLVARYVVIAEHRIPFLIVGETGVLAAWALTGPPIWDELPIPSHVAAHVTDRLPGYAGPVQVGLCRALAPGGLAPRWWCRGGEPGAWVMGLDWLTRWVEHFGPDHGLGVTDLQRLRELATRRPGLVARVPDVVPDLD